MPTKEKEESLKFFRAQLDGAKAVVVSHNQGLSVADVTELRAKLREAGVTHKVVKNTLARIAVKEAGMESLSKILSGPTVVSISKGDVVAPAKVLVNFAKDHEKLVILGGVIEGKPATAKEIAEISALPSKEELVAKLLGSLNSPVTGLLRVINGPATSLVRALNAIVEKKAAAGA
jgi:large subunit ribosomal protein L10